MCVLLECILIDMPMSKTDGEAFIVVLLVNNDLVVDEDRENLRGPLILQPQ